MVVIVLVAVKPKERRQRENKQTNQNLLKPCASRISRGELSKGGSSTLHEFVKAVVQRPHLLWMIIGMQISACMVKSENMFWRTSMDHAELSLLSDGSQIRSIAADENARVVQLEDPPLCCTAL